MHATTKPPRPRPAPMRPPPAPNSPGASPMKSAAMPIGFPSPAIGNWRSTRRASATTAGVRKNSAAMPEGGDFVTAPELTPLFGQALARQVAQAMAASQALVLEAGAGTGKLAADLLLALDALGSTPQYYVPRTLRRTARGKPRRSRPWRRPWPTGRRGSTPCPSASADVWWATRCSTTCRCTGCTGPTRASPNEA